MEQAIATVVAAIIAAIAAYFAARSSRTTKTIERKMKIRQARLDERDLIFIDNGSPIPIDMDDQWRDYYSYRKDKGLSRKDASYKVKATLPMTSNSIISESILN